jgi:poly(hydroxyalkanoate) granule-associated protein
MDTKTTGTGTDTGQKKLQDELMDSAHRIWLAGLGALAAAEQEGTKVFSRLVERGKDVESRGKVEFEKAKEKTESSWDSLSKTVDEKVTSALHRMGVPTRDEIKNLTLRVEELNAKVEALRPRTTPATGPATGPVLVDPTGEPVAETAVPRPRITTETV